MLRKCGRCKSEILEKYFEKNRKGELKKCCNGCLNRYHCEHCDFKTSKKIQLKNHLKDDHILILKDLEEVVLKESEFQCPHCNNSFSSNYNLKMHIKAIHDKIKDIPCHHCKYKTATKNSLQKHIRAVHENIKEFHCETCDGKFSTNNQKKIHMKKCRGGLIGSSGEIAIKHVLNDMKVNYVYKTTHHEFIKYSKQRIKFDFICGDPLDSPLFIEYDGRQHFEPFTTEGITPGLARQNFEKTKIKDILKNDFCSGNKFPLLRIPYTEFGDIRKLVSEFIIENTNWGFE